MGYSTWGLKVSDTTEQLTLFLDQTLEQSFSNFRSSFSNLKEVFSILRNTSQGQEKCWKPYCTPSILL